MVIGGSIAGLCAARVLSDCYARQVYRYAMGDAEPAGADLTWLTASSSPDASMTGAFVSFVQSPAFAMRAFE